MNDRETKAQAQAAIHAAMKRFREESYVEPSTEVIRFNEYHKLSRFQLDQGVIALVIACNLVGGSAGDVDLYKLLRCYLHDAEARTAINAIVRQNE